MSERYGVGDVARMAGVSVRTLHHYDEIGLLVPSERSTVGYRLYSGSDVDRLAQVMAYRACGIGLPEIARLLDATDDERHQALHRHIDALGNRIADLERQRDVLNRAWEAWRMGINLNPQEIFEVFGDRDPTEHAEEARERWGDTDAYGESHRRTSSYTKDDWLRLGEESAAIESELAACMDAGEPADSERAKAAAEAHRQHIDRCFYPCSYETQAGLADMYVADPRFAAHYEEAHAGLAAYLRDAIIANAVGRMS
jgi:DNA-binding transcriptional MerR regulator